MKRHNSKIIGVDFDDTLAISKGTYPEITGEITPVLNYILEQQQKGAYIILITMREGKELDEAVKWCKDRGLEFDAINDNIYFMKDFFHNNPRKVFCNEYIDNNNIGGIDHIIKLIKNKQKTS